MEFVKNYLNNLDPKSKVAIASHVNPDGDNIGSILSMYWAYKDKFEVLDVYSLDPTPENLLFLPGLNCLKKDIQRQSYDLFISLDCGDKKRLGRLSEVFESSSFTINIDHHKSNILFADINLVCVDATSTCEVIYNLFKEMNIHLTKNIATCIYTGLSTDTGNFMYDSVNSRTHLIAADLLNRGIDLSNINVNLYESRSMSKTKLFIDCLNTLKFEKEGKIAYVYISDAMMSANNAQKGDTEGIVEFIRDIKDVEVAVLFKEMTCENNSVKISVRSKYDFDASDFCLKFSGGGHTKAAGATIYEPLDKTIDLIISSIAECLK